MDKFLEGHNLPKPTQGGIDNINRFMSIKEVESMINSLPGKKAPGPGSLTGEIYQTFKEEMVRIFYNGFQQIEAGGTHPNLSYEANIILMPRPDKERARIENYKLITHEHRCKYPPQNISQ